ncbi:MAG: hypothetical protein V7677_10355 [Motiliproteus sp.]
MTKPLNKRHCCEEKTHLTEEQQERLRAYCAATDQPISPTIRTFINEGLNYRIALMEERMREEGGLPGAKRAANE